MKSNSYPKCCGVIILSEFGYDDSCPTSIGDCETYLKQQEDAQRGNIGMLMACLNTVEHAKLSKVFENRHWTLVADGWRNPRTGHSLYLYLWKCVGEQPTAKKKETYDDHYEIEDHYKTHFEFDPFPHYFSSLGQVVDSTTWYYS